MSPGCLAAACQLGHAHRHTMERTVTPASISDKIWMGSSLGSLDELMSFAIKRDRPEAENLSATEDLTAEALV